MNEIGYEGLLGVSSVSEKNGLSVQRFPPNLNSGSYAEK